MVMFFSFHRSLLMILSDFFFFFFNDTATTEIYPLPLHDALPISSWILAAAPARGAYTGSVSAPKSRESTLTPNSLPAPDSARILQITPFSAGSSPTQQTFRTIRSEQHTPELQSLRHPVCRLLLSK